MPRSYSATKRRNVLALHAAGVSQAEIARRKRLDPDTVSRWIHAATPAEPATQSTPATRTKELDAQEAARRARARALVMRWLRGDLHITEAEEAEACRLYESFRYLLGVELDQEEVKPRKRRRGG